MRTITKHYYDIDTPNGGLSLELPQPMSSIMDYRDVLVKITDEKVVLGYLVDDSDCENPLEGWDGMGHIYDCRRHSSTLRDYEDVLGLRDGGPDYDLVDEQAVVEAAQAAIFADDDLYEKARAHCLKYWGSEDDEGTLPADFIRSCLDTANELTPVVDLDPYYHSLWCEGRLNGSIGNKHAVLLDVYEHGQVCYSVSGTGPQCRWDNAVGGAVWIPDECCVEEINRRAPAYMTGHISENRMYGKKLYMVRTWARFGEFDDIVHQAFENWGDAFNYLDSLPGGVYNQPLLDSEYQAARELAAQACSVYTDWCNGNTYGVCVATYDLEGNFIEDDAVYGFIGDDDAYSSLQHDYFPKETT